MTKEKRIFLSKTPKKLTIFKFTVGFLKIGVENLHFSSKVFHYVACAELKVQVEMVMIQPIVIEIDKWLESFVHSCQKTTEKKYV